MCVMFLHCAYIRLRVPTYWEGMGRGLRGRLHAWGTTRLGHTTAAISDLSEGYWPPLPSKPISSSDRAKGAAEMEERWISMTSQTNGSCRSATFAAIFLISDYAKRCPMGTSQTETQSLSILKVKKIKWHDTWIASAAALPSLPHTWLNTTFHGADTVAACWTIAHQIFSYINSRPDISRALLIIVMCTPLTLHIL